LRKVDVNVDAILDVDKRRRELIGQQEALNQKMNEANDKIAQLKKSSPHPSAPQTKTHDVPDPS